MKKAETYSEIRLVLILAIVIVLLSSLPYLWGAFITPEGYAYTGYTHNIDDGAVYLSWMRQAADGHFFIRNLFTNEPQAAKQFNLLFLLMGNAARLTGLSLIAVFHLSRMLLGIALILMIWQFSKLFLQEKREQLLLIPVVGLTAGVGWLIPGAKAPTGPVDVWQPEAITFLSIYLNPLFLAALILMLGSLYFLVLMDRICRARYAVCAGMSMFMLANIHTYDVLTVAVVWIIYNLVSFVIQKKIPLKKILLSLIAVIIALPAVAYQFYVYNLDPVFKARANTSIDSPLVWSFFAGYGLVLVGAVVGTFLLIYQRRSRNAELIQSVNTKLPVVVWAVIGFVLPYFPFAQQRKLIMGLQIPLAILCVFALSWLIKRVPGRFAQLIIATFVFVGTGSNIQFLGNDIRLLSDGRTATIFAPYISKSELSCMRYLRNKMSPDDTVFAPPGFSLFLPAYSGRQVYYGHWSETPEYTAKIREWLFVANPNTSIQERANIIKDSGVNYFVLVNDSSLFPLSLGDALEPTPVHVSGNVSVYRVNRAAMANVSSK